MVSNRRIACWMSDKKSQKINWPEFEKIAAQHGLQLFKLDLSRSLESQGPFCVFLHKLTDIIAAAHQGDTNSINTINKVEQYLAENPSIHVIDPIPNVRRILDRFVTYSIIRSTDLDSYGVFTPNFCSLTSEDVKVLQEQLSESGVTYPFISKPTLGHGSRKAHEMSIIFNEKSLIDCKTPCVAQSFIKHNAILYKIFIVGTKHFYVERPSLKNFHASSAETIHFDSSDISKAGSQSSLSILDPEDVSVKMIKPDLKVFKIIVDTLRGVFGMDLLGVDVVIENSTGRYGIIDVNAYPGYDGFPNFFNVLLECIKSKVDCIDSSVEHTKIQESLMKDIPQIEITEVA